MFRSLAARLLSRSPAATPVIDEITPRKQFYTLGAPSVVSQEVFWALLPDGTDQDGWKSFPSRVARDEALEERLPGLSEISWDW